MMQINTDQNFQSDTFLPKDSIFNNGNTLWRNSSIDQNQIIDQEKLKICSNQKCKTKQLLLFQSYIRYSKNKIIDFENAFMDFIYNSQKQIAGFKLEKYDSYVEILGPVKLWIKLLKKFVIQHDFSRNYKIIKKIGSGTQGIVYVAKHKKQNKDYAVKIFDKKHIILEDQEIMMITKEVEMTRLFTNSHLCQVYEVFECKKHLILIMDLFEGGELVYSLKIGGLSEIQSILIIKPLFEVICQLHEKGIFHRDIKPQNIMLQQFGKLETASLIDLGLADYYHNKEGYLFTQCGTPGYVAPEVLLNEDYDLKVDVYSLSLVLFLILTGKEPFSSKNLDSLIEINTQGQVNLSILNVSENCLDFLKKTLETNPKKRLSSSEALQHPFLIFGPGNHVDMLQHPQQFLIKSSKSLKFRKSIASLRITTDSCEKQQSPYTTRNNNTKKASKHFSIRKVII